MTDEQPKPCGRIHPLPCGIDELCTGIPDDESPPHCPRGCGSELEPLISYIRGHKSSDGWHCPDCDKSWLFSEFPYEYNV